MSNWYFPKHRKDVDFTKFDEMMRPQYLAFAKQIGRYTTACFVLPTASSKFGEMLAYGTFTFLDTGKTKVWVTCYHFVKEYEALLKTYPDAVLCIGMGPNHGSLLLSDVQIVDYEEKIDLAIIHVPFQEIAPESDCAFFQVREWPLQRVKVGACVTVIGYPKCHVEFDADGKLTTGRSWLGFQVSSVSDRHFVLANQHRDRTYMYRDESTTSAAPLLLPGMSGSPAFCRTPNGLHLVGFLYEGNDSDGTIFCTHASFLTEDGVIDHHALPI